MGHDDSLAADRVGISAPIIPYARRDVGRYPHERPFQVSDFQLGTDLPTIAKQLGVDPSQAKVVQRRPALIQDLEWRPQPLGASSQAESVQEGDLQLL